MFNFNKKEKKKKEKKKKEKIKNKKTKQKKKTQQKKKQVYKTPILSIRENIVFTNKAVWAYYVLAEKPYDFLSVGSKISLANQTTQAMSSIVRRSDLPVDCHLLIVNNPFDPSDWEAQMIRNYNKWESQQKKLEQTSNFRLTQSREPFNRYIEETKIDLAYGGYQKRISYFGVKLFNRGSFDFDANPLEVGWEVAKDKWKSSLQQVFSIPDERITEKEERRAAEAEKALFQILESGALKAKRPDTEELLLTMKRRYYPAMPVPYLEIDHKNRVGLSDLEIESGGEIYVNPRNIKMVQMIDGQEFTGYRATFTFSSFPRNMEIPSIFPPFFNRPSVLPFTCSSRFTLTPTEQMKKEEGKKKLEAEDEISNLASSGQSVNQNLRETLSDLNEMDRELTTRKEPWVTGSYKITVEGVSEEFINETFAQMKQEFSENDITLNWTSGDQLDLFREEQIGGEIMIKDFLHITNLAMLSIAGINHGGSVGDPITEGHRSYKKR